MAGRIVVPGPAYSLFVTLLVFVRDLIGPFEARHKQGIRVSQ